MKVKKLIQEASSILLTSGAGMSVESTDIDGKKLQDFRGPNGLWNSNITIGKRKINVKSLTHPSIFGRDIKLAWTFYGMRYDLYKNAIPHKGYEKLLKLVSLKEDYFVVTSNIDGQYRKMGFDEDKIYEIHGRIDKFQCQKCNHCEVMDSVDFNIKQNQYIQKIPTCPKCHSHVRPNVMLFNDYHFNSKEVLEKEKKFKAFVDKQIKENKKTIIVEIGAGSTIPTIRSIGDQLHENLDNFTLIRVNPAEIFGPDGALRVKMEALEFIEEFC